MAVMDLVPPPVAMMAMSGTWGHREADCSGNVGWRSLGVTDNGGGRAGTQSRE